MTAENDAYSELEKIAGAEKLLKGLLASGGFSGNDVEDINKMLQIFGEKRQSFENKRIPEHVYINLPPGFASVAFTVPYLDIDIPENPADKADESGMVITLRNNNKYKRPPKGYNGLSIIDYDLKTEIESVRAFGEEYKGEELLQRRDELLQRFFVNFFQSEEAVERLTEANERSGLGKGSFLYRAITSDELYRLKEDRTLLFSQRDPSANFENEEMFNNPLSQAKHYAEKTSEGYAGKIIRWKIEHPLLYRVAGTSVFRVSPLFAHFLPAGIEISEDKGKTFTPFIQSK